MKTLWAIPIFAALFLEVGCAYRGAVYSEYTQFALDVRATQESSAPLKLNLGYDRGVSLYAPKLNAKRGDRGESVSVISWNTLGSVASPAETGTDSNSILRVDAGFISGVAANVASAPSDATVVVVSADRTTTNSQTQVRGRAGERISNALSVFNSFTEAFDSQDSLVEEILEEFAQSGPAKQAKIQEKAIALQLLDGRVADAAKFERALRRKMDGTKPDLTKAFRELRDFANLTPNN